MKESERFREFAEKFMLARAPDGPEGVWQAVLDAKTAYKQIEQATEEYARPEREAQQRLHEQQKKFMEAGRKERALLKERKKELRGYADGGVVVTQPEDKSSWRSEFLKHFDRLGKAAPQWSQYLPITEVMKPPDSSSRKT